MALAGQSRAEPVSDFSVFCLAGWQLYKQSPLSHGSTYESLSNRVLLNFICVCVSVMCVYCVLVCVYMGAGLPLLLSILVVETLRLALTDFTSLARQQAQGPPASTFSAVG